MQYKLSMFNNIIDFNNEIVLFNSLSQKIIRVKKNNLLLRVFQDGDLTLLDYKTQDVQCLIDDRFIVPASEDELKKRDIHFSNLINKNKLVLTVLATEQCNYRCKYCYETFEKGKISIELQNGFVNYLSNNMHKYDELQLRWFGGEPLLAMDVIEEISSRAIKLCDKLGKVYSSEIVTNGYLLTLENFKKLLKLRVNKFKITLDGPKQIHDSLRVLANGEGTFDRILENLRNIKKEIQDTGFKIIIRSNISTEALDVMDMFLNFLHIEFGDDSRFTFKFKTVDNLGGTSVKNVENKIIPTKQILFNKLITSPYKLNYDTYFEHLNTGVCRAGKRNNYVLGSDGTIFKCLVHFDKDENKIGKLDGKGNMVIDEYKLSNWVERSDYTDKCKECKNSPRCMGGKCIAKRIFNSRTSCVFDDIHVVSIIKMLMQSSGVQKIQKSRCVLKEIEKKS